MRPSTWCPALTLIVAGEEAGRLHPEHRADRRRQPVTETVVSLFAVWVGEAVGEPCPGLAAVGGAPDRSTMPFIAARGVEGAGGGVRDDVVHRLAVAERAAQLEALSLGVGLEDEGTFAGLR